MVDRVINRLVGRLLAEQLITEEYRDDYIYALTCIVESMITITSIVAISLVLSKVIPTIGFLLYFFSLRKRSGGFHARTYGGCYAGTIITYLLVVYTCEYFISHGMIQWFLFVVSAILVFVIGSVNHPNMNMNTEEAEGAKDSARLVLILEICIIGCLVWLKADRLFVAYLCCGVILCGILLCLAKLTGQEVKTNEERNRVA